MLTKQVRTASADVAPYVPRRVRPVRWWAALGLIYVVFFGVVMVRWLTSGDLGATPHGPDPIPGYALWACRIFDVASIPGALAVIYFWGIKPWRREGRITTDGVLIIACFLSFFGDPLINYLNFQVGYNTYHFNIGGWLGSVPGVVLPRGHYYVEPLLGWMPAYIWAVFLPAVLGCVILRRSQRRWPTLSTVGHFAILFGFFTAFDLAIEPVLVRLQLWAYPGVIRSLSLWPGTVHQFPLYEGPLLGLYFTAVTYVRWSINDRGLTIAERGLDQLRLSARARVGYRVLANTAIISGILFLYSLSFAWFAAQIDAFPEKMPSYLLNNLCGEGTPYPCPGPTTPIFRPASQPPVLPPPG